MAGEPARCRFSLRWLAVLMAVGVGALSLAAPPAESRTNNRSKPVLIMHGLGLSGTDCAIFDTFKAFLLNRGYQGMQTLKTEATDANCQSDVSTHGQTVALRHATSADGGFRGGPGEHPAANGAGHTPETDYRHEAYHIAWYIHDQYSKFDKPVDIVAHSAGGVLLRYALQQVDSRNPKFPPKLLVEDVITAGSPHGGARLVNVIACGAQQCRQLAPGSSFINNLNANPAGRHPNPGNNGEATNWTIMGAGDDSIILEEESLVMNNADVAIFYENFQGYEHDQYFKDTSNLRNARSTFRIGPGVFPRDFIRHGSESSNRGRRGARWIDAALVHPDF